MRYYSANSDGRFRWCARTCSAFYHVRGQRSDTVLSRSRVQRDLPTRAVYGVHRVRLTLRKYDLLSNNRRKHDIEQYR